jgi:hypothetical protein
MKKKFTTDDTDGTDGLQRRMLPSVPSVPSVVPPPLHPWNLAAVSDAPFFPAQKNKPAAARGRGRLEGDLGEGEND